MKIKQLNNSELQIMEYLWKLQSAFMKDIVEQYPEPKPAYTTIATVLGRMCEKKYVGFRKLGRDKQYYPILKKNTYFSHQIQSMITHFFNDSTAQFASFFTKNANLNKEELEELQKIVNEQLSKTKETKK